MKISTSFHKSNFGSFGQNLPCDIDGYVYLTAEGWMTANVDGMAWDGYDEEEKREQCKELASKAREATEAAQKALTEWQEGNA